MNFSGANTFFHPRLNFSDFSLNANSRVRVFPNKCIHIKRSLVGRGKLLVNVNEEVQPHDILGKSTLSAGFSVINLAKKLGVTPSEGLKYIQRPIGKAIFRGELLAYKKGLLNKKFITSPTDGLIEKYDSQTGELRIQFLPKEIPLTAGVIGVVDEVDHTLGEVLIKSVVTEIYGVFGSGKERSGVLDVLGDRGDLVHPSQITEDFKQHIIVAGAVIYGEALRKAAGFGLFGVIAGGLNAEDYKGIINSIDPKSRIGSDVGMSIFATEGFGPNPIGEDVYDHLKKNDGKFVIIHGNTNRLILPSNNLDSIITLRKTSLPLTNLPTTSPEVVVKKLKVGGKIRIIWPPFMGSTGTIVEIDKTATKLESGISTYMVTVEIATKKIKVPYTNLEIIG